MKCLMLETPEKKKFFTLMGNYKQLIECCRAFKTKMFVVNAEIKKSQIMNIGQIVKALCDPMSKGLEIEHKVVERKKVARV